MTPTDIVTEQIKVVDQEARPGYWVAADGTTFPNSEEAAAFAYFDEKECNNTHIAGQPEVSHIETKVVTPAYDETVVTGYVCNKCGATK